MSSTVPESGRMAVPRAAWLGAVRGLRRPWIIGPRLHDPALTKACAAAAGSDAADPTLGVLRLGAAWFGAVGGSRCPWVVWPRMLGISPLHLFLHFRIGALPEAA